MVKPFEATKEKSQIGSHHRWAVMSLNLKLLEYMATKVCLLSEIEGLDERLVTLGILALHVVQKLPSFSDH